MYCNNMSQISGILFFSKVTNPTDHFLMRFYRYQCSAVNMLDKLLIKCYEIIMETSKQRSDILISK